MHRGFVAITLLAASSGLASAEDWPQWLGPKRDGVWRDTGLVEKFPSGGPQVVWRKPVGLGYAGPAVAGGKVFVTDFAPTKELPGNQLTRANVPGMERVYG